MAVRVVASSTPNQRHDAGEQGVAGPARGWAQLLPASPPQPRPPAAPQVATTFSSSLAARTAQPSRAGRRSSVVVRAEGTDLAKVRPFPGRHGALGGGARLAGAPGPMAAPRRRRLEPSTPARRCPAAGLAWGPRAAPKPAVPPLPQVERVAKVGGLYKNFTSGQALSYLDGTLPGGAWGCITCSSCFAPAVLQLAVFPATLQPEAPEESSQAASWGLAHGGSMGLAANLWRLAACSANSRPASL